VDGRIKSGHDGETMSYARSVLQPNEQIVMVGRLHWIIYARAIVIAVVGLAAFVWLRSKGFSETFVDTVGAIFAVLFLIFFLHAWFRRWITEFAVTDRRIIYKVGFITRHTVEMNMDKVVSVDIDQSILGRILDYGTIHVVGAGGNNDRQEDDTDVDSMEHMHNIAHPLALRSAITAR
jgi:uncharacterized membrane protein YdbT with pleckstrin-like domain